MDQLRISVPQHSEEYVLTALMLRCIPSKVSGTLYKSHRVNGALKHHGIHPYEGYFTNPFTELSPSLIKQMDKLCIRVLSDMLLTKAIIWTDRELSTLRPCLRKLGYKFSIINHCIRIYKPHG